TVSKNVSKGVGKVLGSGSASVELDSSAKCAFLMQKRCLRRPIPTSAPSVMFWILAASASFCSAADVIQPELLNYRLAQDGRNRPETLNPAGKEGTWRSCQIFGSSKPHMQASK